jgi:hypothetical protein
MAIGLFQGVTVAGRRFLGGEDSSGLGELVGYGYEGGGKGLEGGLEGAKGLERGLGAIVGESWGWRPVSSNHLNSLARRNGK